MRSAPYQKTQVCTLKGCATIVGFVLLAVQCSWTPQVQTPIHRSQVGTILLQTSESFMVPPQHPQVLSQSIIKRILQGISQRQEHGILQELLIANPKISPVFSETQIDFLTPYFVEAFSKATPDELVRFQNVRKAHNAKGLSGTVALFAPSIFFLTLDSKEHFDGNSSKLANSSHQLQQQITLDFLPEQAVLPFQEADQLMNISSKDIWVAVDYGNLKAKKSHPSETLGQSTQTLQNRKENGIDIKNLQEQLQNLQNRVDEQDKEIQRLQQNPSPAMN